MAIGIQGGLAKATTGYAYTRIQNDSAAIVASLMDCGHPFAVPGVTRPGYGLLDSVMLQVMLTRRPASSHVPGYVRPQPGAAHLPISRRACLPGEIVRLVLTLPKLPFVAGVAQLIFARTRARFVPGRPPAPRSIRRVR